MTKEITILGKTIVGSGNNKLLKQNILNLLELVSLEEGCIDAKLFQSNDDANVFWVYQKWEDRRFHRKYMNNKVLSKLRKAIFLELEDFNANELTLIK